MNRLSLCVGAASIAVAAMVMVHLARPVVSARAAGADEGPMPELGGAIGWLNSAPLTRESLRGKVVLVNFWTYSCINSLRELPYIRSWAAKYKDAGLIVIGVHAPEFGFEKERANVENAVRELKIAFPVPIDSGHNIWNAFRNDAWPADYIFDAKGRLRYRHYGEGEYDKSERIIQELLREIGARGFDADPVRISAAGAELPPSDDIRSPETYVGYARAEKFASAGGLARDSARSYSVPPRLSLNQWALGGSWKVGPESGVLQQAPGRIAFGFHSRDLHMVLAPPKNGKPVRFRVTLNGAAPGRDRGVDVDADGAGELRRPRMFQLIRQKGRVTERLFEIEFLDPEAEAFSFTFG